MIEYLLNSTLCLAILYLCYYLFFSKGKTFKFNRYYLLFSLVFSFLLPLVQFSIDFTSESGYDKYLYMLDRPMVEYTNINPIIPSLLTGNDARIIGEIGIQHIVVFLYILVSLMLLFRFIRNLFILILIINKGEKIYHNGFRLILSDKRINPCSFFNSTIVNREDFQDNLIDSDLLNHEFAHVTQFHTIDILIIEFIQVVFWFNPLILLFKNSIRENHEYLADNKAVEKCDNLNDYLNKIINHTFLGRKANLVSGFNYRLTRNRLLMLAKEKKEKWFLFKLGFLLPILLILIITVSCDLKRDETKNSNRTPDELGKVEGQKSIAVLPFWNDTANKDINYLCDGLTAAIMQNLANSNGIKVKSSSSVESYRNTEMSPKIIANQLGVLYILEGSVRKVGDNLRVTAQLIDAKTGDHLWADTYDGKYTNQIFEFQSDIAKKIASVIDVVITPEEEKLIDAINDNHIWADTYDMDLNDVFTAQNNVSQQVTEVLLGKMNVE